MSSSISFDAQALQGRVAVVTGAAGGLGLSICEGLLAMGARVAQVDISHAAEPTEADGMLRLHCDIADAASVARMAEQVHARLGTCDVLVNNAAVSAAPVPLESLDTELWDRLLRVNLRGALLCAQAFVHDMFAREHGSIVNVASIAAESPTRVGAYGAAKAALRALTQQMAVEWGPRGVRANSVSPGMIRTPLSEVHYRDPQTLTRRTGRIPLRRLGRPDDIAGTVCFLASDAAGYVNGQDLVVDGGFLKASLSNLYTPHS